MAETDHRIWLVYGGSFDPPHRAHVELPGEVRVTLGAERIVYVPAGRAPHKAHRPGASAEHRLAMLRLALANQPASEICTWEMGRPEPTYTVTTLEYLRQSIPADVQLRLLIGSDMMVIFDQWRQSQRIEQIAPPVVMMRPPHDVDSLLTTAKREAGLDPKRWQERIVPVQQMNISSTELRQRLTAGDYDAPVVQRNLPPAVLQYIREHQLYLDR